jgi:hypothetical protein
VIDDAPRVDFGPYWYEMELPKGVKVYLRQKRNAHTEFELTFEQPTAGVKTGYGTVGGAVVLTPEKAQQFVKGLHSENVHRMYRAVRRRLCPDENV